MQKRTATIQNEAGIHCRPSAAIIKAVEGYPGTFCARGNGGQSDLESILTLMTLGLECGAKVELEVSGPKEESVADQLVKLFEYHFDFPPSAEQLTPERVDPESLKIEI